MNLKRCLSVCVSATRMSCAKTAELMEMLFGDWHVGEKNHVLDGFENLPTKRGNFGDGQAHLKALSLLRCI